jgi:hypothetical protein
MKIKIRTVITLFFAFFGGTIILKFLVYNFIFHKEFNIEHNIYEEAFIALFIAVLLTIGNGVRIKWDNLEKNQ